MENSWKENNKKYKKKVYFKLPQKKRPHHQFVSDSHSVCVARHQRRHQRKYRYLVKLSKQYKYM